MVCPNQRLWILSFAGFIVLLVVFTLNPIYILVAEPNNILLDFNTSEHPDEKIRTLSIKNQGPFIDKLSIFVESSPHGIIEMDEFILNYYIIAKPQVQFIENNTNNISLILNSPLLNNKTYDSANLKKNLSFLEENVTNIKSSINKINSNTDVLSNSNISIYDLISAVNDSNKNISLNILYITHFQNFPTYYAKILQDNITSTYEKSGEIARILAKMNDTINRNIFVDLNPKLYELDNFETKFIVARIILMGDLPSGIYKGDIVIKKEELMRDFEERIPLTIEVV